MVNRTINYSRQYGFPVFWLALAPVLALSTTLIRGLLAGLVLLAGLACVAFMVSLFRNLVSYQVRLPVIILITATVATLINLFLQAYMYEITVDFGIYLPLLVFNGLYLARSEEAFLRKPVPHALADAFMTGLTLLLFFLIIGLMREFLSYGSLLRDVNIYFASMGKLEINLGENFKSLNLFRLAPGGLICAGLVTAALRYTQLRRESVEVE